jgi:hypothetical protein
MSASLHVRHLVGQRIGCPRIGYPRVGMSANRLSAIWFVRELTGNPVTLQLTGSPML